MVLLCLVVQEGATLIYTQMMHINTTSIVLSLEGHFFFNLKLLTGVQVYEFFKTATSSQNRTSNPVSEAGGPQMLPASYKFLLLAQSFYLKSF